MIQIDDIGVLYTAPVDDTSPIALPGYHVNATHPVAEWAAYKVTPATPRRVFGGIPTCFYTFADKAQYESLPANLDITPPTREAAKAARAAAVQAITVTTAAGHTFDGDEVSQGRMARAILALQAVGAPNVTWVLADNSVIQATAAELTEALALAGAAQAALWVLP